MPTTTPTTQAIPRPTLHLADAVRDPQGRSHRPGAVFAQHGQAADWGTAHDLQTQHAGDATDTRITRHPPGTLLIPGLVNAHAHFELAAIGPQPYTGSFTSWVTLINKKRASEPQAIAHSVQAAAVASLEQGIEAVGDIGGGRLGQEAAWHALQASPLRGLAFPEFIGHGPDRIERELERLPPLVQAFNAHPPANQPPHIRRGASPHAPYSTGPAIYQACTQAAVHHRLPLTTHLAELPEEAQFVAHAAGPFRDFLETLGAWQPEYADAYQAGLSPVQWMQPYLEQAPWLVAHCNHVSDEDLAILAHTQTSVAYCPIASHYFQHQNHRYRDMLDAGVHVCLGTDSIVCQPPNEPHPHGLLPQLRFLHQRDQTDPDALFHMATTHGRRALQLDDAVTHLCALAFDPDQSADPFTQALQHHAPARGVSLSHTMLP